MPHEFELTSAARRYLAAFETWLHLPTPQTLERRADALRELLSGRRVVDDEQLQPGWIEGEVSALLDRCYERRDKLEPFIAEKKRLDKFIPSLEKMIDASRKATKAARTTAESPTLSPYLDLEGELVERVGEIVLRNPDGISGNEICDRAGVARGSLGETLRELQSASTIRKEGGGPRTRYLPDVSAAQAQAKQAMLDAAGVE